MYLFSKLSSLLGNAPDKTGDKEFMVRHAALSDQFKQSQEPLFHAQDIVFPLYTDNMKIVDSTGRRVKLAGGNWSGGHMCRHCVDGLQMRSLRDIAMHIRFKFKMNVIRLTYSLQLIYDNNVIPAKYLKANPDLIGKTAMQIFDITVKTLTEVGLMVILNNHTSTSQWCCSNDDGDGLWWSRQYPQYLFFQHVKDFAKRYKDNERVIGMDMRNQIRKANGLQPSWGDGNPKTDWKRAAQISSEIALKQAPHWLIIIGGLNYQLDLSGVKQNPIILSVPNKLVYTGHFYGFSWPIPSWQMYSYDSFEKKLFNTQTYVRALGAPYLLGQFGNNNQDIPWKYLMRYLKQTDIDWTYWALDGFKCQPEKDQTYGVFTNDFSTARHPEMLEDMIAVGPPKTALQNYWSYLPGKNQKKPSQQQQNQQAQGQQPHQPSQNQPKQSQQKPQQLQSSQPKYQQPQKPTVQVQQTKPVQQPHKLLQFQQQQQISDQVGLQQIKVASKQQSTQQKKKQYFEQLNSAMRQTTTTNTNQNVPQYNTQANTNMNYNQNNPTHSVYMNTAQSSYGTTNNYSNQPMMPNYQSANTQQTQQQYNNYSQSNPSGYPQNNPQQTYNNNPNSNANFTNNNNNNTNFTNSPYSVTQQNSNTRFTLDEQNNMNQSITGTGRKY